jgi:hypothetical protein
LPREYATVHRASRPFGIVFGFHISGNSRILKKNWMAHSNAAHDVNYQNLICVLGKGVFLEKVPTYKLGKRSTPGGR